MASIHADHAQSSTLPLRMQNGKNELVVVATPSPINPLKTTLGLSVIHSMPGAQCRKIDFRPMPLGKYCCDTEPRIRTRRRIPRINAFRTTFLLADFVGLAYDLLVQSSLLNFQLSWHTLSVSLPSS